MKRILLIAILILPFFSTVLFTPPAYGGASAACDKLPNYTKRCECMQDNCDAEGIKMAEDLEKLLFLSSPDAKDFISFVDVAYADGHLLVWIKKRTLFASEALQEELYNSLLTMWRGTVFVRERYYGNWVEIKYTDIEAGKIRTIKKVR